MTFEVMVSVIANPHSVREVEVVGVIGHTPPGYESQWGCVPCITSAQTCCINALPPVEDVVCLSEMKDKKWVVCTITGAHLLSDETPDVGEDEEL